MFLVPSCIEWGETLTFEIVNATGQEIVFIKKRGVTESDTTILGANERVTDFSSEGSGNAPPVPFMFSDSIIITFRDTIVNTYSRLSQGKNPFVFECYEEVSRTETKYQTTISYEYLIEPTDFK